MVELKKKYELLEQIETIDVSEYAKTRNFLDGVVTELSPFISRGLLSSKDVFDSILRRYSLKQAEKFLQQVLWREYFYRVWEFYQDDIFTDIDKPQENCENENIPDAVLAFYTGIEAIDKGINDLYKTGYLHNHMRLYIASLVTNISSYHWLKPAKWMYYHLLDGDIATNMLSWQWVAGTRSKKKYYANQDNINHFTKSNQSGTFLDHEYEVLDASQAPGYMNENYPVELVTVLPDIDFDTISEDKVVVHNSYTINPDILKEEEDVCRVLLLEPNHYEKYPVSNKVIEFTIALAKNQFPNILVRVDNFESFKQAYPKVEFHFEEHMTTKHYTGIMHDKPMVSEKTAPLNSFFKFWNYHLKLWKKNS